MKPSHLVLVLGCVIGAAMPASAQRASTTPQGAPGTVTLSLEQYDRLLERAEHPVKRPEPPPIPAVLGRADLQVRVAGDRARGTFTLEGEVFQSGATKVPLVSNATLLDAHLGTTAVPLITDGAMAVALIDGPRPFTISLDWGTALASSPGRVAVQLPVPMAGSAALSLDLPGKPADVRIAPGAITRMEAVGDLTHVEATLVPGSRATVSWSSRESTALTPPQETRTLADIKTMVRVGEAEASMTALVDVTVLRGEPDRFEVRLPQGFSATGASGSALASTEERPGAIVLVVQRPADRRHQFLLTLERAIGEAAAIEMPLLSLPAAERETGEVAVEATGTVDLTAQDNDTLRRMDVREASATLRSLARSPILAALRYHRRGTDPAVLSLNVTRFPDAAVIAAVAERAIVTTLVTAEGRTLTEIALTMRNRAQPFLRVQLPRGASVVSAEVDGEPSKPALGADGVRIPLLRPGFRPTGPYAVSFVYVQDGQSFAKKGRAEFALPKMDVPVTMVEWEMFVPDRFRIRRFDGNASPMPAEAPRRTAAGVPAGVVGGVVGGVEAGVAGSIVGGTVGGSPVPGTAESVTVVAAPTEKQEAGAVQKTRDESYAQAPSVNVFSLQRRVAGVLPVRVDVPRAGAAYRFIRPLVLDETTSVSFDYRMR